MMQVLSVLPLSRRQKEIEKISSWFRFRFPFLQISTTWFRSGTRFGEFRTSWFRFGTRKPTFVCSLLGILSNFR